MANTYTQIYIHIIFAVKDRESLLRPDVQEDLYLYLAGACKLKLVVFGGMFAVNNGVERQNG